MHRSRNKCSRNNRVPGAVTTNIRRDSGALTPNITENSEANKALSPIIQTLMAEVSPDSEWKERLKAHFDAYPGVNLAQMHFPANWKQQSHWA
jgi:hypothetical protein